MKTLKIILIIFFYKLLAQPIKSGMEVLTHSETIDGQHVPAGATVQVCKYISILFMLKFKPFFQTVLNNLIF